MLDVCKVEHKQRVLLNNTTANLAKLVRCEGYFTEIKCFSKNCIPFRDMQ
jgi:hypothetical protein